MQPDYDCVVVGAGMVGAAQALALERLGLNVLAIDTRGPFGGAGGDDVRGLALAPSSRNILAALGVWPDLERRANPIEEVRVSDQGHFGAAVLHARDAGLAALGYVCPADELLRTLESALVAAVDVRWQTTVDDVDVTGNTAFISMHGGGGNATVSTRLVIAADGAGSPLRTLRGIGVKQRDYDQFAIVANLSIADIDPGVAFERFTANGPLALLPITAGRHVAVRCCRTSDLDRLLALDDDTFLAELERGFGPRFGRFSAPGRRTHHPLRFARAQRIVDERLVLVGAAANCVHPNGAQGLNLGLRDIAALAAAIRRAGGDPGAAPLLAAYAKARQADHRAVLRLTDTLAQLFSSRLPFVPALRSLAMLTVDVAPLVKRHMIRRACGLLGETPLADWSPATAKST